MSNQRIIVSDTHHRWLQEQARVRGITMGELLRQLIEAGMAADQGGDGPTAIARARKEARQR